MPWSVQAATLPPTHILKGSCCQTSLHSSPDLLLGWAVSGECTSGGLQQQLRSVHLFHGGAAAGRAAARCAARHAAWHASRLTATSACSNGQHLPLECRDLMEMRASRKWYCEPSLLC